MRGTVLPATARARVARPGRASVPTACRNIPTPTPAPPPRAIGYNRASIRTVSNRMRPIAVIAAAALGLGLAGTALAVAVKPETAVAYRQGLYHAILWNFVPMARMAQGRERWNQAAFAAHAADVAFYSTQLLQGFTPGSITAHSEAKPQIWRNWADFSARMKNFEHASARLAAVAKSGNEAAGKAAFKDTAATCQACHDHYRRG